ncbi:hypothetical protein M9Y10_038212 [Tritrichomonas musculus]|uniref:HNH nuclease domain-containing protein n=1 Tax=Tritrichomonas musculus TaxID=1915356 RepID=A0ABR2K7T7_9EUKA
MEQTIEFITLTEYPDYEILNDFPYTIRRKKKHYVIKESINQKGYPSVHLNCKKLEKHRIIAKQFLPNPNNFPEVDHINKIRDDYHIDNLRWCDRVMNNRNRSSNHTGVVYEFVYNIPDEAMVVDFYDMKTERREFNDKEYYYYYNEETGEDIFYRRITDEEYRVLHVNECKCGLKYVNLNYKNNKTTSMMINRFKRQHDITVL